MSLSFRERAAIDLYVNREDDEEREDDEDDGGEFLAVEHAQLLANACCSAWGHVYRLEVTCDRCGAVKKQAGPFR